jgi:hypothetical protein
MANRPPEVVPLGNAEAPAGGRQGRRRVEPYGQGGCRRVLKQMTEQASIAKA